MSNAFWAADSIAQAFERTAEQQTYNRNIGRIKNKLSNANDEVDNYKELFDQACRTNSANYAEKYALRTALAKLNPNHPLLVNTQLRERIHSMADKIFTITNGVNHDMFVRLGKEFDYDGK